MQVSANSGASSLWALQRLFKTEGGGQAPPQPSSSDRQKMPGGVSDGTGGFRGPQMSQGTMSAALLLQMEPPSATNIASDLISSLDTNADGAMSAEEVASALSANGEMVDVSEAFAGMDSNGDGSLDVDELTSAIEEDFASRPPPPGPPPGPPPSSSDLAAEIFSTFDQDGEDGLSLSEITSAFDVDEADDATELQQAFSSLDANGDGVLSNGELALALQAAFETQMVA